MKGRTWFLHPQNSMPMGSSSRLEIVTVHVNRDFDKGVPGGAIASGKKLKVGNKLSLTLVATS